MRKRGMGLFKITPLFRNFLTGVLFFMGSMPCFATKQVGIIDTQRVLNNCDEGRASIERLKSINTAKKKALDKQYDLLHKNQEKLEPFFADPKLLEEEHFFSRVKDTLSPEEYLKRRKELDEKYLKKKKELAAEYQKKIEEFQAAYKTTEKEMQEEGKKLTQALLRQIKQVQDQIAKSKKLVSIWEKRSDADKQNVADQVKIDVTDEVIYQLNKQYHSSKRLSGRKE